MSANQSHSWSALVSQLVILGVLIPLYLSQHILLPPNAADGALILDYIRMVHEGQRSYWDFVDAYGPLNWVLPRLSYALAGEQVIGVRLGLLAIKWIFILLSYVLVKHLSNGFYAGFTAVLLTILLGMPWQYLQTAYAFFHTLPFLILTWICILCPVPNHRALQLWFAGFCTAWCIWTKVNTGFFLLAAGLFYCFFLEHQAAYPLSRSRVKQSLTKQGAQLKLGIHMLGLVSYGVVFYGFIKPHMQSLYWIYLMTPLGVLLLKTLNHSYKEYHYGHMEQWGVRLRSWGHYGLSSILCSVIFFVDYYGLEKGLHFIQELQQILSLVDYALPVPGVGLEGIYGSFNQYYWLQFSWVILLLMFVYLAMRWVSGRVVGFHQSPLLGLWAFGFLNAFVMYSRSDETHIFQSMVPLVPLLGVLLFYMEKQVPFLSPKRFFKSKGMKWGFRGTVLLFFGIWLAPLALDAVGLSWLSPEDGWHSPHLKYLAQTDAQVYILTEADRNIDDASKYIDEQLDDGEPVLVLTTDQIINYNSHTEPVGGRYRYLLYLLRSQLLDRERFDQIAPKELIPSIIESPPPMIVARNHMLDLSYHIPEFAALMKRDYQLVKSFEYISIYQRSDLLRKESRVP